MADDIILLDGIKYLRYTPKKEAEFERMVVENAKEIFGENAIYLDIKKKIANALGAGTIPDGYLFYPEEKRFVLVEVELSSHDVYSHVAKQLNKFVSAFRNYRSRQKIATTLRDYIESDPLLRERMEGLTGDKGLYEFLLNDVFEALHETGNFEVFVIIEEKTEQIIEALRYLNFQLDILEVAIYAREGAESVKAMRFKATYQLPPPPPPPGGYGRLNWFQKCVQEKIKQGYTMAEAGKICKNLRERPKSSKLNEESFLAITDKNGKRVFRRILDFAKEKDFLIRWGAKGFSFNATRGGEFVALFFGYSPDCVFKQSIYTGFEELRKKTINAEVIIEEMRSNLLEMGIFQELSGQNKRENIKCVIDFRLEDNQISRFLKIIEQTAKRIEWKA
ncbi:hypothetical protein DRQ36_06400 [bacterium]|nr:MAG: hypothetical protein DRQ36_06400 [bacterium]